MIYDTKTTFFQCQIIAKLGSVNNERGRKGGRGGDSLRIGGKVLMARSRDSVIGAQWWGPHKFVLPSLYS